MMIKIIYKIKGLDCAEEVSALKNTVGILPGVKDLDFDLLNAKISLNLDTSVTEENEIISAVHKAGLEALPWVHGLTCNCCEAKETLWQKHGRLIMCALGGLFLFLGLLSHSFILGSIFKAILIGEHFSGNDYPPVTIIFYIISIILSFSYIARKSFTSLVHFRLDMNFLMFLAVLGAVIINQFFEAGTVMFLFALAQLLEAWSIARARKAISNLMKISPQKARYICPCDGDIIEKPVEEVPCGVTVLVSPGERIPLDGIISKGSPSINEAPITGESVPVMKNKGDEVFAGTVNEDGSFEFKVTKTSDNTALARIIHMVEEAQGRRSVTEQWIEKFARYYTPFMVFIAFSVSVILPLLFHFPWYEGFYRALVILVISCPCALVISTPVSIIAGLTSAARNGVLIKGGIYLELPACIKAIAMDKTGTVTYGHPSVNHILPSGGHSVDTILSRTASLEFHSKHPIGRAILKKARENGISVKPSDTFREIKGKGAEGDIDGKNYWIGSNRMVEDKGKITLEYKARAEELEFKGHTVVFLGNDDHVCGILSISDTVRDGINIIVNKLKDEGIEMTILTGDNEITARTVSRATGIKHFKAGLLPEDKAGIIKDMIRKFKYVAMVGDGINDAPAMAQATLGIAMGGIGSDVAIETADIVLISDDLSKLPWLIKHSKYVMSILQQNIYFSIGIKFLFMILAFMGFSTLWMAIGADMGASLLVIFNALRLLKIKKFK